jgi:hypothetical protein
LRYFGGTAHLFEAQGIDKFVDNFLGRGVEHPAARIHLAHVVADGMHQMRFAQPYAAIEE